MKARFSALRWLCLIGGDMVALCGLAICDFIYRPQWQHGAVGIGLCVIGGQWIVTGIALFNRHEP